MQRFCPPEAEARGLGGGVAGGGENAPHQIARRLRLGRNDIGASQSVGDAIFEAVCGRAETSSGCEGRWIGRS